MTILASLVHAWSPSVSFATDPGVADLVGSADLTADGGLAARINDEGSKGRYSWDFQNNGVGLETSGVDGAIWDGSTAKFSISFWAKRDVTNTNDNFLECYDSASTKGWQLQLQSLKNVDFKVDDGATKYTVYRTDVTNLMSSTTTWYHVVITYDASLARASRVVAYVNGTSRALTVPTNGGDTVIDTSTASSPLKIGKSYSSSLYPDGKIDGVAIYNDVLTAGQVSTIYSAGREGGLPWLGDNFEAYTAGTYAGDLPGWSAGSNAPSVQIDVTKIMGDVFNDANPTTCYLERTVDSDGELAYDWRADSVSETVFVYKNGSLQVQHNDGGYNTFAGATISLAAGDVIKFGFGTYADIAAIDNLVFTPSLGPLSVNDIDLGFEVESFEVTIPTLSTDDAEIVFGIEQPAVEVNWKLSVNSLSIGLEIEQPGAEVNAGIAINDLSIGFEAERPAVAVNWDLAVDDADVRFTITTVTVYKSADLYVRDIDLALEFDSFTVIAHRAATVNDIDLVFEGEPIAVSAAKKIAVNDADLVFESEQILAALHANLEVDDIDLTLETERPRVIVNGLDSPRRSRLFLTGGIFLGTPNDARLLCP